jgi:hypothetical protein
MSLLALPWTRSILKAQAGLHLDIQYGCVLHSRGNNFDVLAKAIRQGGRGICSAGPEREQEQIPHPLRYAPGVRDDTSREGFSSTYIIAENAVERARAGSG